jgi:uncharacterized protein YndB with AHSA1/START domain
VAHTAGAEPSIALGDEAGTVVVAAQTPASRETVWRALSARPRIDQWFGALTGELAPGAHPRLDFGDGDFFDLEVEAVDEPVLRWAWRFMGCGPRDEIQLRVDRCDGGTAVTVTDHEPDRERDEALALGEGWRDFTMRLQRYLATGERSRYDWRSDVDVWIELPLDAEAARRLVIGSAAEWLPLAAGASNLITADALVLGDGELPAAFAILGVEGAGPASVRFELRPDGMAGSLPTRVAVVPRGDHAMLAIGQTGFRLLAADDATRRRIRERFAAAWLTAARRARELADRAPMEAEERAR